MAGDDVDGGELLADDSRQGSDVEGVYLDDVAGLGGLVLLGLAHGVLPLPPPFTRTDPEPRRLHELASSLQVGQDSPHHRHGYRQLLPTQQHCQLVLPPRWVLFPHSPHRLQVSLSPGRPTPMLRQTRPILQRPRIPRLVPVQPAIECGPTDPPPPTGQRRVLSVRVVPLEPAPTHPSLPRQLGKPQPLDNLHYPLGHRMHYPHRGHPIARLSCTIVTEAPPGRGLGVTTILPVGASTIRQGETRATCLARPPGVPHLAGRVQCEVPR